MNHFLISGIYQTGFDNKEIKMIIDSKRINQKSNIRMQFSCFPQQVLSLKLIAQSTGAFLLST